MLARPRHPTADGLLALQPPAARIPVAVAGHAGRKVLVAGEATEAHNITLPASAWRLLERIGAGNRSEGVRRLVEVKVKAEAEP